jgi:hypothetical protein
MMSAGAGKGRRHDAHWGGKTTLSPAPNHSPARKLDAK